MWCWQSDQSGGRAFTGTPRFPVRMDHRRVRDRIVETFDVDLSSIETVLRAVPRHRFVPEAWRDLAYANRPLPLGNGTTISVPSVMASMVDHLALSSGDRVLEMGTGREYYATVVADLVGAANVFSIEYDPFFATARGDRDAELGGP